MNTDSYTIHASWNGRVRDRTRHEAQSLEVGRQRPRRASEKGNDWGKKG